jgi:hypothetical protein
MVHGITNTGKVVPRVVVCLLLCGLFAGELPELLTLVDNTANDYTICSAGPASSTVSPIAKKRVQIADSNCNMRAPEFFSSLMRPLKKNVIVSSDAFVLDSVLRI